jgi:hypothetical protein
VLIDSVGSGHAIARSFEAAGVAADTPRRPVAFLSTKPR